MQEHFVPLLPTGAGRRRKRRRRRWGGSTEEGMLGLFNSNPPSVGWQRSAQASSWECAKKNYYCIFFFKMLLHLRNSWSVFIPCFHRNWWHVPWKSFHDAKVAFALLCHTFFPYNSMFEFLACCLSQFFVVFFYDVGSLSWESRNRLYKNRKRVNPGCLGKSRSLHESWRMKWVNRAAQFNQSFSTSNEHLVHKMSKKPQTYIYI